MYTLIFLALMLVGTLFLGINDVQKKKFLLDGINDQLLLGFSWFLGGLFLFLVVAIVGVPEIQEGFWAALAATVFLNVISQIVFIRAFKLADASLVAPLRLITPPFVIITGFIVLGEVPTVGGVVGIFLTVFGLMTLLSPGGSFSLSAVRNYVASERGVQFGLLGSFLFALSFPFDKQTVLASSGVFATAVRMSFVGILVLVLNAALNRQFLREAVFTVRRWRMPLLSVSAVSAVGDFLTTQALAYSLAAYAASLKRLWPFWTILLAGRFLKEKHITKRLAATAIMFIGIIVMVILG